MKFVKRSPEVQEAIKHFEELSGYKVLKAKRFQGSMKGYVQFILEANFESVMKIVDDVDSGRYHYALGQCMVTFNRDLSWLGGKYIGKIAVEVRWEDLGMSYNSAYGPTTRSVSKRLSALF